MITAQDVKSGYGIKIRKPHTSVLPYLREQEAKRKAAEKAEAGSEPVPPKAKKSGLEEVTDKKAALDQYDAARLEILRG